MGDRVKINAFVYVCNGVTIEDGVMISAGTVFTNDRFPRATTPDLQRLRPSEPDEHTLATRVREGATLVGLLFALFERSVQKVVTGTPSTCVFRPCQAFTAKRSSCASWTSAR